jgi:hypothetical protein
VEGLGRVDCGELADLAAEIALGAVTGRERAEAVAHLGRCAACRERVGRLMITEERLVGLLPAAEPPPGFEARVAERTGPVGQDPGPGRVSRTRRVLAAAVVTVAAALAGLGTGWGMHAAAPAPAAPLLSSAVLFSADREPAGTVFAYQGSPRWLYLSVNLPPDNGTVICEVAGKGRRLTAVGSFRLTDGYGAWGGPVAAGAGPLDGVRLISPGGAVLATAGFPGR